MGMVFLFHKLNSCPPTLKMCGFIFPKISAQAQRGMGGGVFIWCMNISTSPPDLWKIEIFSSQKQILFQNIHLPETLICCICGCGWGWIILGLVISVCIIVAGFIWWGNLRPRVWSLLRSFLFSNNQC